MGFWDYVILASVLIAFGLAVFIVIKRRKEGKGSCGDCAHCPGCAAMKEQDRTEGGQK